MLFGGICRHMKAFLIHIHATDKISVCVLSWAGRVPPVMKHRIVRERYRHMIVFTIVVKHPIMIKRHYLHSADLLV